MSTENRVLADELYRQLESLVYISKQGLEDSPRRDSSKKAFMDVIEKILDKVDNK